MQKFNYHSHTYRCGHADINYSDEEYVKDYIKMGFKKMAFTDHCPEKEKIDTRKRMRMEYDQKNEYLNSINNLKNKYKNIIEIKSGYEVEFLPDQIDNLKELKNETDIIILGQHFVYDENKNLKIFGVSHFTNEELIKYADYIEQAMKCNITDIIAHPDIYMLKRQSFGEIEKLVAHLICSSAERYNIPLEINLSKIFNRIYYKKQNINNLSLEQRINNISYPCKEFWNIASQYNIKVLYGIDTHYKGQINVWNESVKMANYILGEEIISKLNFIEDDI